MGPELIDLQRFGFKKSRPTKSSDCYALGMVIYETIGGNLPFHEHTDLTVVMKVSKGEHPPRGAKFTRSLWKILELSWAFQPRNRPTIEDILQGLEMVSNLSEPPPGVGEEIGNDGDNLHSASDSPGVYERTENDGDDWDSANSSPRTYEEMESDLDEAYAGSSVRSDHYPASPERDIMERLLSDLQQHRRSWAFLRPVDAEEVTDYYETVPEPMGKYLPVLARSLARFLTSTV